MKNLKLFLNPLLVDAYRISDIDLSLYRIFFCTASLVFYGFPNFLWISKNPDYIFFPPKPSFASLLHGFPPSYFFYLLNIGIVILYFILLFGWHTRLTSIFLSIFLILGYNFTYSFGKIDHNIMLVLTPLLMAYTGWGNHFSVDQKEGRIYKEEGWPICFLAFFLGFAMFTASIPKIVRGWLSFDSHAVKAYMQHNTIFYDGIRKTPLLYNELMSIDNSFFWESMDYLTFFFEFGFLIAVVKPLFFRLFVISAVIFHLFVYLTFQIAFTGNLLVYALFLNLSIFRYIFKYPNFDKLFSFKYMLITLVIVFSAQNLFLKDEISVKNPSIFRQLLTLFSDVEMAKTIETLTLFTIALIITSMSILTYLLRLRKNKTVQRKTNTLIQNTV